MTITPGAKDLSDQARDILLRVWDPIGVREFLLDNYDAVRDEYDAYLPSVVNMINEGAKEQEIADYLFKAETQLMHRRRSRERAASAANSLRALRDQQP